MKKTRLLAVALLAAAGAARAAPVRLAVAPLDAPPDLTFMGKSVAQAIAEEAKAAGFEVLGPEAVEAKLGRAGTAKLVGCADDARCLAEQAGPLGVERVVGGWLQKDGERYKVGLVHADVAAKGRIAAAQREAPIASRRLKQVVAGAVPALLSGKADARGVLEVTADVAGAQVQVDDAFAGAAPLVREVPPGRHKVQVSAPGYAAADPVWVEVPAGGRAVHKQRLYAVPAREAGR